VWQYLQTPFTNLGAEYLTKHSYEDSSGLINEFGKGKWKHLRDKYEGRDPDQRVFDEAMDLLKEIDPPRWDHHMKTHPMATSSRKD
jgi:hypothetical protein